MFMRLGVLALALISLPAVAFGDEVPPSAEPPPEQPAPPQTVPAQPAQPDHDDVRPATAVEGMGYDYSSPRQKAGDNLLMPDGDIELGGEMAFVTADESLGNAEVKFTDVALLRLHVRRSIKRKVELVAGTTILPKQPSYTDEPVWQSAMVGVRGAAAQKWVLNVGGAGGMMLGNTGWWWTAGAGMATKRRVHETLTFELGANGSYTRLVPDGPGDDPWLVEAGMAGDILLHTPRGEIGAWIGSSFSIPVVHADLAALDPQPRLDFHIGMVYALIERWDLYVEFQVVDRGDLGYPATLLPILDGGFDQNQLVFGLVRHITKEPQNRGTIWLAM
jgi:hypothetical protein